jgi:hypothetical protein
VEGKGKGNQQRREKAEERTVGEKGEVLEKARVEGIGRCASKRVQKRKLICYSGEKRAKEVSIMSDQSQYPFKWRHFQADIILLCVRWYLRYALSYRDLARDDGGARFARGSYHDLPLGSALCS